MSASICEIHNIARVPAPAALSLGKFFVCPKCIAEDDFDPKRGTKHEYEWGDHYGSSCVVCGEGDQHPNHYRTGDASIDRTQPGERWAFNADVARVFDNMLVRSIPEYVAMRQLVFNLGCQFWSEAYDRAEVSVVDLGASRGEALAPFVEKFGIKSRYVGVEISDPMLAELRKRFVSSGPAVDVEKLDLRSAYPNKPAWLTLAILTLQFIPIEYRQRVIADAYRNTLLSGGLIVVEKVLGSSSVFDHIFLTEYYAMKQANGYTPEDIDRKRLSLEGVLVPQTAASTERMLEAEGFRVERFWQWCNFVGWIAIK